MELALRVESFALPHFSVRSIPCLLLLKIPWFSTPAACCCAVPLAWTLTLWNCKPWSTVFSKVALVVVFYNNRKGTDRFLEAYIQKSERCSKQSFDLYKFPGGGGSGTQITSPDKRSSS